MTDDQRDEWIERVAAFCTAVWGLPPITGRILGHLMVCDPAEQSAGQIAEAISASRASLTSNMRQLVAAGFVRRRNRPRDRIAYFWIDEDAWNRVLRSRMESLAEFRDIAGDGLDMVGTASSSAPRMRAAYDAFDWMAKSFSTRRADPGDP